MSKKATIIIAAIVVFLVVPVICSGIAYFIFLRPASLETVCENYEKLNILDKETCLVYEEERRQEVGIIELARRTKCEAGAKDIGELLKCNE